MIIAECGQNFCGSMDLACTLIKLSKKGGADLCKFQLYDHDKLYKDTDIPNVELTFTEAKMLFDYGKSIDMEVFFSVFDVEKVKWCEEIGVKRYKLACGQNKNSELIQSIRGTGKNVIISKTENFHIDILNGYGKQRNLYCPNGYPPNNVALGFPDFSKDWYPETWFDGFSDHTIGLDCAKIALARGADIIEKHFCLDHKTGIDAEWSMDYDELVELKRWHDLCASVL